MSKSIKQKQKEYNEKYNEIPIELKDRLEWMYNKYNIDDSTARKIINERQRRMNSLYYNTIKIVLYQDPQGAKRPRYRWSKSVRYHIEKSLSCEMYKMW